MKEKDKKYYIFNYNLGFLNFLSLILLIGLCVLTFFLYKLGFINDIFTNNSLKWRDLEFVILISGLFIWIILHELIHGFMYYINGAKWKNIVFGVELEKGVFCCLCNEEITRKNILISSISPCFLIGIVTYILGIILHNMILIIFSIMNIGSSIADIMLFLYLLRLPKEVKFREYNDALGFCITSNVDIKDIKHYGMKLVEVLDNDKIIKKHYPKIYVSKISKAVILGFELIIILSILNILF